MTRLDDQRYQADVRFLQRGTRNINRQLELIAGRMENLVERILQEHRTAPLLAVQRLRPQLGGLNNEYWSTVGNQGRESLLEAAQLSSTRALDVDFMSGMPSNAVLTYMDDMETQAANVAGQQIDQELMPRVGMNQDRAMSKALSVLVGVAALLDVADVLAGIKHLAKDMRDLFSPRTPRGAAWASHRLLQDQTARAYHNINLDQGRARPWIEAYDWHLSSSHPGGGDICDEIAAKSPYRDQDVPGLPHPYCFCYVTPAPVDPNKMTSDLVDGKYDDWLAARGCVC